MIILLVGAVVVDVGAAVGATEAGVGASDGTARLGTVVVSAPAEAAYVPWHVPAKRRATESVTVTPLEKSDVMFCPDKEYPRIRP